MDEFKQFKRFIPRFWQEGGIVETAVEIRTPSRKQLRRSSWSVGIAAIAFASLTATTVTIPPAEATRRTAVVEEAPARDASIATMISPYTEVSSEHWGNLRDLMRTFARTPERDRYQDPEPFI
jgi:hypothetical protein